jgi:hypothetical protein
MWKLKACPRDHGDLFINQDLDGWNEKCLQCGYRRELRVITAPNPRSVGNAGTIRWHGVSTPEERKGVAVGNQIQSNAHPHR